MPDSPEWIQGLTDDELRRRFGIGPFVRGEDDANLGHVTNITIGATEVIGHVRGPATREYLSRIDVSGGHMRATCTCPIRVNCQHCVATLIAARSSAEGGSTEWQRVLATIVDDRPDEDAPRFGLRFEFDPPGRVGMRIVIRERGGDWQPSPFDWNQVRRTLGQQFPERQRRALVQLQESQRSPSHHGYGGQAVLLISELDQRCWVHLDEALRSGVEFLPPAGLIGVSVPPPAQPSADLRPATDGGLVVAPGVRVGDELVHPTAGSLLGRPVHGFVRVDNDTLVLARFERELSDAEAGLVGHDPIIVPAADVPLFSAGYLPSLSRHLRIDQEMALPETQPPRLVAHVTFGDERAGLDWSMRYRIGDQDIDLDVAPAPHDPPVRDQAAERALLALVDDGPWWGVGTKSGVGAPQLVSVVLTGHDLIDFVSESLPRWQKTPGIEVESQGEAPAYRRAEGAPEVSLEVTPAKGGWFGLDVEVTVDGEQVPFIDLFTALSEGAHEMVLDSGTWFSLDRPELRRLRDLIEEAATLSDRAPDKLRLRPEHAGLWAELLEVARVKKQADEWRDAVEALLHPELIPAATAPTSLHAELRPYQLGGLQWLVRLWKGRLGGVLADEMGLGKTLQALSFIAWLQENGDLTHPAIVVAPTSVVGTWVSEAKKFTPDLKVVAITETSHKRGTPLAEVVAGADLVVTSYTLARLDAAEYVALQWSVALIDEAQFVKNRQSRSHRAIRRLPASTKIALTGTPLENNLMDLWSMLALTAPGLFHDPDVFTEMYRHPIEAGDADALARLRRRIRPLVLRRTKRAVASELPPKQEQVVEVELSPKHRQLYDLQLQRERQKVLHLVDDLDHNRVTVLRALTKLRQLALSPHLVDDKWPAQSAKIDLLIDWVKELSTEGHRALVFSQFTSFLHLVRDRLTEEGIAWSYLDGSTRNREEQISEFREGNDPVFLISLKAGGFGLTLTEADYVFILDPWWNPAAENQAIDRTHRIGQTEHVMVYRLVSADTIEQKVLDLQKVKRDLFDLVVEGAPSTAGPLTAADVRALLED